jgi:hypothetical protein
MCLAMNPDKLSPGERCASTSNRNFEGRQGRGAAPIWCRRPWRRRRRSGQRWRMHGATPEEVQAKLGKILQGADPPQSEDAIAGLLAATGFGPPTPFFSSLFWGAWLTRRV